MKYRVFISNRFIKELPGPMNQRAIKEYCAVYKIYVAGIDMHPGGMDYRFMKQYHNRRSN